MAITQQELLALFLPFGNIKTLSPSLKLQSKFAKDTRQSDPQTLSSENAAETSYCEIEYEELSDATEAATNMNGFELYGKFLIVTKRGTSGSGNNSGSGSGVLGKLADKKAVWDEENSGLLQ